jgi:uroporphyrinogen decarboxylase
MFRTIADYPVQAVNWHDRMALPGLKEAKNIFRGAVMGGIEQYKVLNFGSLLNVELQVHDAIDQTKGRRLIVTPGCTYPMSVPHSNLIAMRRAVDR